MDVAQVSAGLLSPRRVIGLVERLMDEPWSRFRAKQLGGEKWRQHLGWGPAEHLQADLIDAVRSNTAVTAAHGSGKQAKRQPPWPRPPLVKPQPDEPDDDSDEPDLAAIEAEVND